MSKSSKGRVSERWRVAPGSKVDLPAIDPADISGAPGDRRATEAASAALNDRLLDLQRRLWAERERSLLVVLQAMDTGGKDGTVKHVFHGVNPMGVHAVGFGAPSEAELAHDFLWRIHAHTPERGDIGIFNRSHYEDVVVVRVEQLVPKARWRPRYEAIAAFEAMLHAEGTTVVKLFLHISQDEQAERLQARLDDPTKRWKFKSSDLDSRGRWDDYMAAYEEAIERTTTADCPWYVIPANRKWFRNWAVSTVLVEALESMDPQYPEPAGLDGIRIE